MDYWVEDLRRYGVVLVPPSAPEFTSLANEIQKRLENPAADSPPLPPEWDDMDEPGMILRNDAQQAIAALAWVWKTQTTDGRTSPAYTSMIGGGPSLLGRSGSTTVR